ncbi:3-deoxy-8-phosphooctulonate synthase [bacterium]|nr:3-deoxy-8-phosphooctulonate synthase [bacterium]
MSAPRTVPVRPGVVLGGGRPAVFIGGPCVIEDDRMLMRTAEGLAEICEDLGIGFIFKTSYDKANRTSGGSFRGPGLREGIRLVERVKKRLGVAVLLDVHKEEECGPAADVADVLQIPAFLCRQTDLIRAAAKTGRVVNIKKGQFLSPEDARFAAAKVTSAGNPRVTVTERGATFGYGNLVVDMRSIEVIRDLGIPVIFDATHSVQMPGAGGKTGGDRRFVPVLARAAVAAGVDGIFMEVHPNPGRAKSDAANQMPLSGMRRLLKSLIDIDRLVKKVKKVKKRRGP